MTPAAQPLTGPDARFASSRPSAYPEYRRRGDRPAAQNPHGFRLERSAPIARPAGSAEAPDVEEELVAAEAAPQRPGLDPRQVDRAVGEPRASTRRRGGPHRAPRRPGGAPGSGAGGARPRHPDEPCDVVGLVLDPVAEDRGLRDAPRTRPERAQGSSDSATVRTASVVLAPWTWPRGSPDSERTARSPAGERTTSILERPVLARDQAVPDRQVVLAHQLDSVGVEGEGVECGRDRSSIEFSNGTGPVRLPRGRRGSPVDGGRGTGSTSASPTAAPSASSLKVPLGPRYAIRTLNARVSCEGQ
jgi:hypothetical protein